MKTWGSSPAVRWKNTAESSIPFKLNRSTGKFPSMSEKIAKTPWNIPYHEVYKVVAAALVIAWQSGPDRYYNLMGAAPTQG